MLRKASCTFIVLFVLLPAEAAELLVVHPPGGITVAGPTASVAGLLGVDRTGDGVLGFGDVLVGGTTVTITNQATGESCQCPVSDGAFGVGDLNLVPGAQIVEVVSMAGASSSVSVTRDAGYSGDEPFPVAAAPVCGDADGDGAVTSEDAAFLLAYIAEGGLAYRPSLDVNADTFLDGDDVAALCDFVLEGRGTLTCGGVPPLARLSALEATCWAKAFLPPPDGMYYAMAAGLLGEAVPLLEEGSCTGFDRLRAAQAALWVIVDVEAPLLRLELFAAARDLLGLELMQVREALLQTTPQVASSVEAALAEAQQLFESGQDIAAVGRLNDGCAELESGLAAAGRWFVLALRSQHVLVINQRSWEVEQTIALPVSADHPVQCFEVETDGQHLWVPNADPPRLQRIRVADGVEVDQVALPGVPGRIALSPDRLFLGVAAGDLGSILVVEIPAGTPVGVPLPDPGAVGSPVVLPQAPAAAALVESSPGVPLEIPGVALPSAVASGPGGSEILVADFSGSHLLRVDLAAGTSSPLDLGGRSAVVDLTVAATPAAGVLLVSKELSAARLDLAAGTLHPGSELGSRPVCLAATPSGRVFVGLGLPFPRLLEVDPLDPSPGGAVHQVEYTDARPRALHASEELLVMLSARTNELILYSLSGGGLAEVRRLTHPLLDGPAEVIAR